MENVFNKACLIQLKTSCWQGSRMLEPGVMERIGNSNWLRGRKYLVSPDLLNPIRAVISRARKDLSRHALPFPIEGLTLVPKERINVIEEVLENHRRDFNQCVDQFIEGYQDALEEGRTHLGEHFNEGDYPADIWNKFSFAWQYLTIETPGKYAVLSPEIYEREKKKFEQLMEETRELAISALRTEFADCVSHLVERLTGSSDDKPKVFKNSMVEKIQSFLSSFNERNIFQDDQLAELVEQARALLSGVTPEELRGNEWLKRRIQAGMSQVKAELDQALTDVPRRKVRLAV